MNVKAIDLFCGIGGLTYGVQQAGIDVVAGIDLDISCQFAYEINNNSKFIGKSISEISSEEIDELYGDANVKILMGCAPCQPFSRHQKDKENRSKHTKWGLLDEFSKKIKDIRPDIVSMENVPELEKESIFTDFLEVLRRLNYSIDYKVVNAADYGVPQRRKRLLLLASKSGDISLIKETHKGKHFTVKDAIGMLPAIKAGESAELDNIHVAANLAPINLKRIEKSKPGSTWRDWPEDIVPQCYKKPSGKSYGSVYGRMSWDKVSPTLTTQFNRYGTGRFGHPSQNRAISIREGAILQTFPLDYTFVLDNMKVKTNILARQIGNAVPVRLGEVIGNSIIQHLKVEGYK